MNRECAWCSNTIDPNNYWMIERYPPFYVGSDLRFHAEHCIVDYLAAHGVYAPAPTQTTPPSFDGKIPWPG